MHVTIVKERDGDRIEIRRSSGALLSFRFPRKGPAPHDAVHYFVERTLGMRRGFWGLVADDHDPAEVQDMAKAGGHPSSSRATVPDADIVELIQAERLVECFEAALWSGAVDPATFRTVAEAACAASHVPLPSFADIATTVIFADIAAVHADWISAPTGPMFSFDWPPA